MKTIQSFNDPNKIHYSLPAPTYTSTETTTLKDQLQKANAFPDIKNSFDYKGYSGKSDGTINEDVDDDENDGVLALYNKKHKISMDNREIHRKIKPNHHKSEEYQSPYIHNQYQVKRNVSNKLNKNGSAGSVISAKRSAVDSDISGLIIKNNSKILDDRANELPLIDKTKSQESILINDVKTNSPEQHSKFTPDRLRDRDSRMSSDDASNNSKLKGKMHKNEKYLQKALEPSEFKMRTEGDESSSPTRRILENKISRLKSNHSKEMNRNDSQSQLSNNKLKRNDSQRELTKDSSILASSDRVENSKSKRMIKNLREHIALKLYEHNIPSSNYHRVMGKGSYNASNNSYIQKMLDAYNVFNYQQPPGGNKYHKLKKNLKNNASYKLRDENSLGRNQNISENANNYSPGYNRDSSVVLPELSRSPGVSLMSNRKQSIMNMKNKQAEKYMKSAKRNHPKVLSVNKGTHKSTDLEAMPSISKQLDRILNSQKMNISKNVKQYRSPNHFKIKSISNENDRRELAIDGLPSTIVKPNNKKSKHRDMSQKFQNEV